MPAIASVNTSDSPEGNPKQFSRKHKEILIDEAYMLNAKRNYDSPYRQGTKQT